MKTQSFYIDGKWGQSSGHPLTTINPAAEKIVWQGNSVDRNDIHLAVKSARMAFRNWSAAAIAQRKIFLERFAQKLSERKQEFATQISEEIGKPHWESRTEVDAMIGKISLTLRAYGERSQEQIGRAHV